MFPRYVKPEMRIDENSLRDFLEIVLDRDWFHVYSSDSTSIKAKPRGFVTCEVDEVIDWAEEQTARLANLYYAINAPSRNQTRKAERDELAILTAAHTDIDLRGDVPRDHPQANDAIDFARELVASLPIRDNRPTIVDTGNGVQALWCFAKFQKATPDNRDYLTWINKRIKLALRSMIARLPEGHSGRLLKVDDCQNVDRIARLPGTPNYPTAKKLERGCVPVMSRLLAVGRLDYRLEDFAKLPDCPKVLNRDDVKRIDYARVPYNSLKNPYSWEEFVQDMPDIESRLERCLDGSALDKSYAAWAVLHELCEFIERKEGIGPGDVRQDSDLLKNVYELFRDGVDDVHTPSMAHIAEHYEKHPFRWGQLGYDIGNTIVDREEHGRDGSSDKGLRRHRKAKEQHEANTAPEDNVSPEQARRAFLRYVELAVSRGDLPNCRGADTPSHVQPSTDSNLRYVLETCGIEMRWDIMADELTVRVNPVIATGGASAQRPAFHFERALVATPRHMRSYACMELVIDALATVGLYDRDRLERMMKGYAHDRAFHPFGEWILSRPWDGVDRLAELVACIGTVHPLALEFMRVYTRSCVAAVKSFKQWIATGEGYQIGAAVVLIGPQGIGKSRFWNALIPPQFRAKGTSLQMGKHGETDSKAACLSGVMCVLNELGQTFDRSTSEALKDFLTTDVDRYRLAYGRVPITKPRMTVFVGTANEDFQLRDITGSRRYLCMSVFNFDFERLAKIDLQQVYAQAWEEVMLDGKRWWLDTTHDREREKENDAFRVLSEEEMATRDYLEDVPQNVQDEWLSARQICKVLSLRYSPSTWGKVRKVLDLYAIEYREKVVRTGYATRYRVYAFPLPPGMLHSLLINGFN